MYGDKGPPKGYSVPRYDTNAKKHCQLCSSTEHWTYECPKKSAAASATSSASSSATVANASAKKSGAKTVKLSYSQMLKYGVKQKLAKFVPEPTEREVYEAEMKELRSVLTAEVRNEVKANKADEAKAPNDHAKHGTGKVRDGVKDEPAAESGVQVKKERSEERE